MNPTNNLIKDFQDLLEEYENYKIDYRYLKNRIIKLINEQQEEDEEEEEDEDETYY